MTNTRTGEYRIRAQDALAQANRASDEASRLRFLDWAMHWFRLAEMGEKNNPVDLVADPRSGRPTNEMGEKNNPVDLVADPRSGRPTKPSQEPDNRADG